jgi:hypothetical protein
MPTLKQVANDIRDTKIVKQYLREITKGNVNKTKFAEAFNTSLRTLNRILDTAGLKDTKFNAEVTPVATKPVKAVVAKKSKKVAKKAVKAPKAAPKAAPKTITAIEAAKLDGYQLTNRAVGDLASYLDLGWDLDALLREDILEKKDNSILPVSEDEIEITEMSPTKEAVVSEIKTAPLVITDTILSWTVDKAKFISVLLDNGENLSVESTHEHYKDIITHLISDEYEEALIKMSIVHKLSSLSLGGFVVSKAGISFNGRNIKNDLVDDVVGMFSRDEPVEYMLRFFENLMLTPSEHIYTHLWKLIKHAGVTITAEGNVECYKRVKSDFTDCYTGKIPNNIGDTVSMRRSLVNADFNETCAAGLHVCAKQYLNTSGYGSSGIIVKVVVRPQDFVSIPPDYQFTKARTCSYKVVGLDK